MDGHAEASNNGNPAANKVNEANGMSWRFSGVKISFYEMLIRQLLDDNLVEAAESVKNLTKLSPNYNVSKDYLFQLVEGALFSTAEQGLSPLESVSAGCDSVPSWTPIHIRFNPPANASPFGLLDYDTAEGHAQRQHFIKSEAFIETHKDNEAFSLSAPSLDALKASVRCHFTHRTECYCAVVSPDMQWMASGGADQTVYVMDIPREHGEGSITTEFSVRNESLPPFQNLRVYEEHSAPVTAITFHPKKPFCISGSLDFTVKLFDVTKSVQGQQSAAGTLQDLYIINALCVHPCGDFLYVGTHHPIIRIYDLQTLNCYTSTRMDEYHTGTINDIRCTADGSIVASASDDGTVKLWDGVSFRLLNTIPNCHRRFPVKSVRWSYSGRYIVTSGLDGQIRVWDIRNGKEVLVMGSGNRAEIVNCCAALLCDESYIVYTSTENDFTHRSPRGLQFYNALTGNWIGSQDQFHWSVINSIEAADAELAFVTSSNDRQCCLIDLKKAIQMGD